MVADGTRSGHCLREDIPPSRPCPLLAAKLKSLSNPATCSLLEFSKTTTDLTSDHPQALRS
jgi:hypothetical protein